MTRIEKKPVKRPQKTPEAFQQDIPTHIKMAQKKPVERNSAIDNKE